MPPKVSIQQQKWPWIRNHDYAGPVLGKALLIIVDAHSKWIDVVPPTSPVATVEKLQMLFATHGLPKTIVSDNGPAFTSGEFQQCVQSNEIESLRSVSYHPASNGLAERAVQTDKNENGSSDVIKCAAL